jgi:UrcA family protein
MGRKIMNKLTGLLFASAFVLTMSSLPAAASDTIVTKSKVVRFSDLNLSSNDGARTLYERINLAARTVCSGADSGSPFGRSEYRKCIKKAVDDAVAKVDRPTLYVVHQSGGKTPPAG